MCSVDAIQRNLQSKFILEKPGDNLDSHHMSKTIKWAVISFKKEYPLLFNREYSGGRKPKYEWEELLAFDIYCVYSNKRTFRKREEWLSNNDESCKYILNNKSPRKTTLNDFKLKNPLLFIEFFQYAIDLGIDFGLVGGEVVTLDSTKIRAYANDFRTLPIGQLDYLLDLIYDFSFKGSKKSEWFKLRKFFFSDKLPENLVELVDEIHTNLNNHGINLLKTALSSNKKRDWVIDLLDELVLNYDGKKPVNLTDPESRKMRMKDGTSHYAYTLQTARDIKTGFTISQRITQEKNDKGTLKDALKDIINNLRKAPCYILADNGYWDTASLEFAYMMNVIPIIPDITQSMARNGTKSSNQYDKSNMKFNVVENYYSCPFADKIQDTGIHMTSQGNKRVYQANKCPECPFHEYCTPRKYKTFLESPHPLILETKKNFIAAEELFLYKYRGIFSEGGFGTLTHGREYPDLRRRGKQKADLDLKIEAIVDNLIKIHKHLKATLITI